MKNNILYLFCFVFILSCTSVIEREAKHYTGLDCHIHIHPRGEGLYKGNRAKYTLDSTGLSHGCILSQGYQKRYGNELNLYKTQRDFTISRNDWTISESKKHIGLLPFCAVPVKSEWASDEVKRCTTNGALGLKLHFASEKVSLKDKSIHSNFEKILTANSDKLVLLIHTNHNDKKEILKFFDLIQKFPNTKVILAHNLGRNFFTTPYIVETDF